MIVVLHVLDFRYHLLYYRMIIYLCPWSDLVELDYFISIESSEGECYNHLTIDIIRQKIVDVSWFCVETLNDDRRYKNSYCVWPIFFFMNVFIALKGTHFLFLFAFTAVGVVQCGGRKTSPRTSPIVQFIFYFGPLRSAWIFWEIRNNWLV